MESARDSPVMMGATPAGDDMCPQHLRLGILLSLLVGLSSIGVSQNTVPVPPGAPYTFAVPVDEVSVVFHAENWEGLPIEDLKLNDLHILDNGKEPQEILSFGSYPNLPIHAGILIDTSRSVLDDIPRNQQMAAEFAEHLVNKQTDLAFIMRFDSEAKILQDWTNDSEALSASIRGAAADRRSRLGGTIIFDSIYKACRDQFGGARMPSGAFILLFSDGLDNASRLSIEDDIDICQRTHTAIYPFSNEPKSRFSKGQRTLEELAAKTGGRIFFDQSEAGIVKDFQIIEAGQRSEYQLIFKPAKLKQDGSFHRIKLESLHRGVTLRGSSGYYAPRATSADAATH